MVACMPLMAMSQGVITRPGKKPTKTNTQKPPARQLPQQQGSNNQRPSNQSANSATDTGNRLSARPTTGTINGHDYVDLGLSVKWATCNVGATSPSDYGSYFAWGETSTKSEYTEANSITYKKDMGDIAGNPQYDAARTNWGSTWRLPTKAECEELKNKCTWTWTTQGGHNGYRVTSKTNGNSIFVPAAGCRYGASLCYAGDYVYFWSSSPYGGDAELAYRLYFDSSGHCVDWGDRYYGRSVRPVSE